MAFELWALDAGVGEAVILNEGRWYLAAMDRAWRPVEFENPDRVLEWSSSRHLVSIGRQFPRLDEVVIVARMVCLAAWRTGITSSEEVLRLLEEVSEDHQRERERNLKWAPGLEEWNRRFPEINRAALELDSYFQAHGCSPQESLQLIVRTLDRFWASGEWQRKRDRELSLALLDRAGEVYQVWSQPKDQERGSGRGISDHERRRLERALHKLSFESLRCLSLWAEASWSLEDISIMLRIPPRTVQESLVGAVEVVGRPLEELRDPGLAEVCKQIVKPQI